MQQASNRHESSQESKISLVKSVKSSDASPKLVFKSEEKPPTTGVFQFKPFVNNTETEKAKETTEVKLPITELFKPASIPIPMF